MWPFLPCKALAWWDEIATLANQAKFSFMMVWFDCTWMTSFFQNETTASKMGKCILETRSLRCFTMSALTGRSHGLFQLHKTFTKHILDFLVRWSSKKCCRVISHALENRSGNIPNDLCLCGSTKGKGRIKYISIPGSKKNNSGYQPSTDKIICVLQKRQAWADNKFWTFSGYKEKNCWQQNIHRIVYNCWK